MTRRIRVEEIEIVVHCHATEDESKVMKALLNVLPPDLRNTVETRIERFTGYYGNPITRIIARVGRDRALDVLKYIVSSLSEVDKRYLLESLEQRYDRRSNRLFLRLDKQEAFLGRLALSDGSDTVRISISFSIARSVDEVRRLLEEVMSLGKDADRSADSGERPS